MLRLRDSWAFAIPKTTLITALENKIKHHKDRFLFWSDAAINLESDLLTKGVVIHPRKSRNNSTTYNLQQSITVDSKLVEDFEEAQAKVELHRTTLEDYERYLRILRTHEAPTLLNCTVDDFEYFGL